MKWLQSLARFWYDFIVGDDWTIAAVVIVAVVVTSAAAHHGWNAWPIVPVCVAAMLGVSSWRAHATTTDPSGRNNAMHSPFVIRIG